MLTLVMLGPIMSQAQVKVTAPTTTTRKSIDSTRGNKFFDSTMAGKSIDSTTTIIKVHPLEQLGCEEDEAPQNPLCPAR
jgi:hypothetical protein